MDFFSSLTTFDVIYAAVAAALLTTLINLTLRKKGQMTQNPYKNTKPAQQKPRLFEGEPGSQPIQRGPKPPAAMPPSLHGLEGEAFLEQCKILFPEAEMSYRGVIINRGDQIRVVTAGQRILIGEFIGKNDSNVICVSTARNVVAQKLDRVLEISLLAKDGQ